MEQFLAFVDLLGFKDQVRRNRQRAAEVLRVFYSIAYEVVRSVPEVRGHLFSDSLVAYAEDPNVLLRVSAELYRQCLRANRERALGEGFFLLPRGGISAGMVVVEDRAELPNLEKRFLVSPALVHSVEIEKAIKGSRLLIAIDEDRGIRFDVAAQNAGVLLYEHPLTLWRDYIYRDALWFADFAKERAEQQVEIEELLDVAVALLRDNRVGPFLGHYAGTLRIGLLSYSRFLEATRASDLISEILEEFSDAKYWPVWLAAIEAVMQSPDSWAAASRKDLVTFFRRHALSAEWAEASAHLRQPGHERLRALVQEFVDDAAPIRPAE